MSDFEIKKIFNNSFIEIHNDNKEIPFELLKDNEYFGVLTAKMEKVEITKKPLFLLFSVDKTGSMAEIEYGKLTKLNYLIQTFTNIISYLAKQKSTIYICVQTFNSEVYETIPITKLSDGNVLENIIQNIQNIIADGSTNIEIALKKAEEKLISYSIQNPTHQIGHIFMTDGDPTDGERDSNILSKLVNENFHNIFVGFGLSHNVKLMRELSNRKNSEYQFVDNLENTSLVYGETIHQFLYPILKNVEIRIENGLIYNWKTNNWTNILYETVFVGESEKQYHIKTYDSKNVCAQVYAKICNNNLKKESNITFIETIYSLPFLISENQSYLINDLTNYIYRQKVQELLYIARSIDFENKKEFKKTLRNFFSKMHKYMRDNNLLENPFMKLLCEDIFVIYQTIDSSYGLMYSMGRQTTQGRQQTYNISTPINNNFNNLNYIGTPMKRKRTIYNDFDEYNIKNTQEDYNNMENIEEDEDNIDKYKPNINQNKTCYSSPSVLDTMSKISQLDIN